MLDVQWLMLITSLPGASGTPRMRVWRALKAHGAGILRDGVHLLPASAASESVLREQADHIEQAGGNAQLIQFSGEDQAQATHFQALFDRTSDYDQWQVGLMAFLKRLAELDEPESRRKEARLRRELEAITAIDYFPGDARERAAATLHDLDSAVNARFSPGEPTARGGAVPIRSLAEFQGRRWATRSNIWIDRIASAWLIRRFIDQQATFVWLTDTAEDLGDAIGFDFDGATFSHIGHLVTFEVLVHSFELDQMPALAKLAALVHYLDIGGAPVPEAAGFVAMLAGAKEEHGGDDALLSAAGTLLDHLYAAFVAQDGQ